MALSIAIKNDPKPLDTAKRLAMTEFKGWVYGEKSAKKQINCVQFINRVIFEELKMTLNPEIRDTIFIKPAFKNLGEAIKKRDKRLRGVQYALVDLLKRGKVVKPENAKAGDFIQYWKKDKNGNWFGHAAILCNVTKDRKGRKSATLFGAHKSLNGIGESKYRLSLTGSDRLIYLARMTAPKMMKRE